MTPFALLIFAISSPLIFAAPPKCRGTWLVNFSFNLVDINYYEFYPDMNTNLIGKDGKKIIPLTSRSNNPYTYYSIVLQNPCSKSGPVNLYFIDENKKQTKMGVRWATGETPFSQPYLVLGAGWNFDFVLIWQKRGKACLPFLKLAGTKNLCVGAVDAKNVYLKGIPCDSDYKYFGSGYFYPNGVKVPPPANCA